MALSRLSLSFIGNWAGILLLLLVVFLPVYGPVMAYVEGYVLPVTSPVRIVNVTPDASGTTLTFRFGYIKYRACEYLGTSWRINGMPVDAHPVLPGNTTRSPGAQISSLWTVEAPTLEGSEVWFWHRCGFAWMTATKVLG